MRYAILDATVDQVRSVGGTDIKEARSTGIIFATLTDSQVVQLRALGFSVELVGSVSTGVMPPLPIAAAPTYTPETLIWASGFEELRQRITVPPLYGEGFNLAIVDSGIRETHEAIRGRVVYRQNFTSDPMGDAFDHGTGVASIALAMAPLCNILNIKVLNSKGEGTEEEVVLGIDHLISLLDTNPELAPSVINLSISSLDEGNPNNPMRVACRAAIGRGIYVAAAAGNSGPNPGSVMAPACERYVFAVGAARYDPKGTYTLSSFSSRGPTKEGLIKPDVLFFGEDIEMASSASDTATIGKSGTSFSTPFISGLGILYHEGVLRYHGVQYPAGVPSGLDPTITRLLSVETMQDVYLPRVGVKPVGSPAGKDNDYGYGLPLGSLFYSAMGVKPALDLSAILADLSTVLAGVVAVGMMGTMMAGVSKSMLAGVAR